MTGARTEDLIGAWRLVSWQIGTGARSYEPFGSHPIGLLTYTADGCMQASIAAAERPALPGSSPRRSPEADVAAAFASYFSYAGRFEVRGDDVLHEVEIALNPAMVGTTQVRHLALTGDRLVLSATEPVGDELRRHALTWQRAAAVHS